MCDFRQIMYDPVEIDTQSQFWDGSMRSEGYEARRLAALRSGRMSACWPGHGRKREEFNDEVDSSAARLARRCGGLRADGVADGDRRRSPQPPVDLSKWSPEYVRSIAGTEEFDTAAALRQGHAARLQGPPDVLVPGRVRGRPRSAAPVLQGFLRGVPRRPIRTSSSRSRPSPTTTCSTSSAPRCSAMPRRWRSACRSWAAPSSPPRAIWSRSSPRMSAIRPRTSGPAP